jgi:lipopolysaccharide transport system permease protein
MLSSITTLFKAKDLLQSWTDRIIRARYQQSLLGGLWVVIQPVATVVIFTIIFTFFVPIDTGDVPYVVFSYTALVPWLLFANSLPDMASSLVDNMQLITKVSFPREVLVIAALLARFVDFLVSASLVLVLIVIYGVPIFIPGWLFLPIIIAVQLALALGLGLAFAAVNVFYRDIKPLLTLVLQLWFYASPIIYPVELVPVRLQPFYYLNPMAGILEAYRAVLLHQRLPGFSLAIAALVAIGLLVSGYWAFKRVEFEFADII